jgi:hypothetical protein
VIWLLTRGMAAQHESFVYGCSIRTGRVKTGN